MDDDGPFAGFGDLSAEPGDLVTYVRQGRNNRRRCRSFWERVRYALRASRAQGGFRLFPAGRGLLY